MIKNEITFEIKIKDNNSKIRIINPFENTKREHPYLDWDIIEKKENEEEIKDCENIKPILCFLIVIY